MSNPRYPQEFNIEAVKQVACASVAGFSSKRHQVGGASKNLITAPL